MNPDTPILMIALQIPVTPETNVDAILDVIGKKVSQALDQIRREQVEQEQGKPVAAPVLDPEALAEWMQFRDSLVNETLELHTQATSQDLLSALGYTSVD